MLDYRIGELGAFDFLRSIHETGEIVGDCLGRDRAFHALDDQVGNFCPAHVAEHHFAGEDDRARIDLVEVSVLRRRAVSRFEDGVTRHVVDICPGSDTDPTDLRGQRVGEVIAVQVQGGDHIIIARADEGELQAYIGDRVLDQQHLLPLAIAVGIP